MVLICRHVYEYTGSKICPDCGRDTHDPDWQEHADMVRRHYAEGHHLKFLDPDTGGTILGWTSI